MRKKWGNKIYIFGSKEEIEEASKLLAKVHISGNKYDDRLEILRKVVSFTNACIFYDGHMVWARKRIRKALWRLKNWKRIVGV